MRHFIIILILMIFSIQTTIADEIKLYDDIGNRIGTYRKEGSEYVLYDFFERRVENPEKFIKNSPNKTELKECSQLFEITNSIPIGGYNNTYINKNNVFGRDFIPPENWHKRPSAYIIRSTLNE